MALSLLSKKETCEALCVSQRTFTRFFNSGVLHHGNHFVYKDPLNPNSHKLFKIDRVKQVYEETPTSLKRRVRKVK